MCVIDNVGQTSDRHFVADVIREHNELTKKKLKLILNGQLYEARTSKIEFRTWPELKYVYGKAPHEVKTAARQAFESVVLAWFLGENNINRARDGAHFILNINMNSNVNNVKFDVIIEIKEIVEKLYRLRGALPPLQRQLLEELYKKVSRLN